ncbi:MAG: sigma-70 family RNA polymerase sigma factor [Candidatus Sumerlaeia bacterium]
MTDQVIDHDTFKRFQAGEPDAVDAIVRAYQHRLVGYLRLWTRRLDLAEEIAQDVFVMAWEQRHQVYSPDKLRPWLFVLARRRAMREMQKRHHAMELSLDEPDGAGGRAPAVEPAVPARQGEALLSGEFRAHLEQALRTLSPKDQDLIALRYFGGLSIKELADALGLPMGSVGVKLGRALERLRAWFEARGLGLSDYL